MRLPDREWERPLAREGWMLYDRAAGSAIDGFTCGLK
jgi:hypothetical protein